MDAEIANMVAQVGVWRNYTLVATSSGIDDVTFFARYTITQGLDVVFCPILIYDRPISQDENLQNFNTYRVR